MNKPILWTLWAVSTLLMIAGWILPLLTLKVSIELPLLGSQNMLNETHSLLGTIQKLSKDGHLFPALLISLFGVLIPLIKTMSLSYVLYGGKNALKVAKWTFAINKWAMADVFSMSILIAFLTAKSLSNISAVPQTGFYVFTAYVILAGILAQLATKEKTP